MSIEELDQYKKIDIEYVKKNKDTLINVNIPVMRLNKENKFVTVPLVNLDVLLGSSNDICFYIKKTYEKVLENIVNIDYGLKDYQSEENEKEAEKMLENIMNINYGWKKDYQSEENEKEAENDKDIEKMMLNFQEMSLEERVLKISKHNILLSAAAKEPKLTNDTARKIIESGTDVSIITKVTMFENINDMNSKGTKSESVRERNQTITKETSEMVNTITHLLSKVPETKNIFDNLQHFSDGGVIAHCNRVFIMYIDFLYFYNKAVNEQIFVQRLRKMFMEKYGKLYQRLMDEHSPGRLISSVEEVIESGIGRINEIDFMLYPMAAFMHDVGKIQDMDYFEGSSGRDIERIQKHLFNSYYLVSKMSIYPPEIVLTVGFHHEYNNYGYGPFKTLYQLKKEKDPRSRINYILTYNVVTIEKYNALGYFPAKMLEIVDVYDALLDPARKYRKNSKVFKKDEALSIMRKNFIENQTKLDPILFDIFVDYINSKSIV